MACTYMVKVDDNTHGDAIECAVYVKGHLPGHDACTIAKLVAVEYVIHKYAGDVDTSTLKAVASWPFEDLDLLGLQWRNPSLGVAVYE
jgi:hypothetical protein